MRRSGGFSRLELPGWIGVLIATTVLAAPVSAVLAVTGGMFGSLADAPAAWAIAPVSSLEPSSTTTSSKSGACSYAAARTRPMFSASS